MASVDRIRKFTSNPTTLMGFVGKHYAILEDFDPETMDVLIVAKDARRVWIEGARNSRYVHDGQPRWCDPDWGGSDAIRSIGDMLPYIHGGSLVEFVAVATHRPPEPEKQAVPNPMAEITRRVEAESKAKLSLWHSELIHQ